MMDEPEIQPEAGTGNEEVAPEATEEAPVTDTPADDSADGDNGETEETTENHETAGETSVPYTRFKSVNERMKAAEAKAKELETQLAALAPKKEPVAAKDKLKRGLKPAPADMSPLEQMEYYALETLEQHPEILDGWFERKFGMSPDAAAATLSYTSNTTRESILAQFEKACGDRGLDPKNPAIQDTVGRMMDSKKYKTFDDALNVFVKPKTNGTAPKKAAARGPETDGVVVEGLTRAVNKILTKDEAMKLAEKNQRVPHRSITEILGMS